MSISHQNEKVKETSMLQLPSAIQIDEQTSTDVINSFKQFLIYLLINKCILKNTY